MSKYLKVAGAFNDKFNASSLKVNWDDGVAHHDIIERAINHHDALVDKVQKMRQLVKEKDERIDALERSLIDTQRIINEGLNLCANAAKPAGISNRLPERLLVLLTANSVTTLFLLSFSLMGWL